jgi:TonB family protein
MVFRVALTSLALTWSSIAAAGTGAALHPTDNWHVDYEETQCSATRSFGTASSLTVLGIVPSISGSTYKLLVGVPRNGPKFAEETFGTVDFGRGPIRSWLLYHGTKGVKLTVYRFRVSAAEIEQARSATTVSFDPGKGRHYTFALSDMPALLDSLRTCRQDLQRYWNLDGKGTDTIAVPPEGDIQVFTDKDYPAEALMRRQQGTAQYQLLVDGKGAIAGCDVLRPSGVAVLDLRGCEVLKDKAKYKPAIDSHGKPVRSVTTTRPVRWMID